VSSHRANDDEIGRRQMIEMKLQEIVENINDNRKQHTDIMAKFKKELEKQARNKGKFSRKERKTSHNFTCQVNVM